MSGPEGTDDLAGFVRAVARDRALATRLRSIDDPAALVRAAVAEGAALGYRFTAAELDAVMAGNRGGWLPDPAPPDPVPAA